MFMNKWITCSGTSWHFFFGFLLHFFRGWDEGIWTHSLSSICQSVWSTHVFSHIVATLFWVAATLRLLMVAVTNLVGNFQMIQAVVAILFLMEFFLPSFHPQISPFGGISPSKRPSVKNRLLRVCARATCKSNSSSRSSHHGRTWHT